MEERKVWLENRERGGLLTRRVRILPFRFRDPQICTSIRLFPAGGPKSSPSSSSSSFFGKRDLVGVDVTRFVVSPRTRGNSISRGGKPVTGAERSSWNLTQMLFFLPSLPRFHFNEIPCPDGIVSRLFFFFSLPVSLFSAPPLLATLLRD